jgi:cobalt-zinc-cadmium efflux system membrane fusion protein
MINAAQDDELLHAQGEGHLTTTTAAPPSGAGAPQRKMGFGQRLVVLILLTVVVVPPLAGFYSYFTGIPLHLLASNKEKEEKENSATSGLSGIALVSGQAHTVEVADEVAATLGIRKGERDSVAIAERPTTMRPLELKGSTMIIPGRIARIKPRFGAARVVEIAKVWERDRKTGMSKDRELRPGDKVAKGDLLCVCYSVEVGNTKNDLLDALVQLELDQQILTRIENNRYAIPEVLYLNELQQVQHDRNTITRAIKQLKTWDIPQADIDAIQEDARKIHANKDEWERTPEGRWVRREKQSIGGKVDPHKEAESDWGKVALRAPFDGVILEENVALDEMVSDPTINLWQIADVSRLLVSVHCPEDDLPTLDALRGDERRWTVRTAFAPPEGLPGTIDEISYLIDPNQHTAIIKGYIDNPGEHIRGTQFATATVNIPPPRDVVEVPEDAVYEDGKQSVVFVQPDAAKRQFTLRRVEVTHRFDRTMFVRATPIPKDAQLTAEEAEEGLLPKEPLRAGERVLVAGTMELKRVVMDLESRPNDKPTDQVARAKTPSAPDHAKPPAPATGSKPAATDKAHPLSDLEARRELNLKAGKG